MGLSWIKKEKSHFCCLNCNCFLKRWTKSLLKSRDSLSSERFPFLGPLSFCFIGNKSFRLAHIFLFVFVVVVVVVVVVVDLLCFFFSPLACLTRSSTNSNELTQIIEHMKNASGHFGKGGKWGFSHLHHYASFSLIPRRGLFETKALFSVQIHLRKSNGIFTLVLVLVRSFCFHILNFTHNGFSQANERLIVRFRCNMNQFVTRLLS